MAGLGGFAPLPLRLGGVETETSWTASDHAALARDLAAAARTTPFAMMLVAVTSETASSITEYRGVNGIGTAFAPTVTTPVSYGPRLVFPCEWEDESGARRAVSVTGVAAYAASPAMGDIISEITTTGGRAVMNLYGGDVTGSILVLVWGCYLESATIADYGGSTDKEDTETEVVPYAFSQYRALQDARGSAYSKESGTLVHVENLSLARAHAATWRRAERLACNGNPATALEKAEEWRQVLGTRRRDGDTDATLRTRNAAKMRTALGPTRRAVDDAVEELLGTMYARTWRNNGSETIADDDEGTFWPTENPGAPSRDLGGGPWYSDRSHVVIEVNRPPSATSTAFDSAMADLTELLDTMLPATCTFAWVTGADDGFTLDEDLLDEGCLGG